MAGNEDDAVNHHRRSIRLKGYDYSGAGAYFLTLCTRHRECLFGDVCDGEVRLNRVGLLVREEWLRTAELREGVETDAFVIMPNHIHGILTFAHCRGVLPYAPAESCHSPSQTLGDIVCGFKSASTIRINEARNRPGTAVWQRNYYEHVIREENDLQRLRQYIMDNPPRWTEDENHPC